MAEWTADDVKKLAELQAKREEALGPLFHCIAEAVSRQSLHDVVRALTENADLVVPALRPYCTSTPPKPPEKDEVVPIVTEAGDLGVSIYGRAYSIYKGSMINVHDWMGIRPMEYREFGEVIHPPLLVSALRDKSVVASSDDIVKNWASAYSWTKQVNPAKL